MEFDQKLKLIDISSEDDFLIDSRLFNSLEDLRLSVTMDNMNENGEGSNLSRTSAKIDKSTQVDEEKEEKHLSSASIQPGRPSYLRKSSAWDNAFFTSKGLLDPHELSSINKEFNTSEDHLMPVILEDVRARRPNIPSISNIRTCPRDMIDRSLVFKRKNINDARPKRIKTQENKQITFYSVSKNKQMSWQRSSPPIWQRKIARDMDIESKKKTKPGQDLIVSHSNTHSASVSSTKTPITSSTNSNKFENLSSSHKSPPSTTIVRSLESSLPTSSTNRAHSDSNHRVNVRSGLGRNLWPPSHFTRPVASVPRESPKPSGLCMPSPKFGFFDEERTFDGNSNQPQKQEMSASEIRWEFVQTLIELNRPRRPIDSVNRGSVKTIRLLTPKKSRCDASIPKSTNASYTEPNARRYGSGKYRDLVKRVCAEMRRVCAGEHERIRVGQVDGINITPTRRTSQSRLYDSSVSMFLKLSPPRDKGITSTSKSRNQENEASDLINLSNFIVDDGIETELEQRKSPPHMRTPLVEKKYVSLAELMRSDNENN